MSQKLKKIIKTKKLPIIIGTLSALFVAVFLIGAISSSLSGGSAIKVVSAQSVFQSSETPQFIFVYKKQANIFNRFFTGIVNLFSSENKEISATVKILDSDGEEVDGLNPQIKEESSGKFSVDLDHSKFQQELRPGKYKMKFEIKDGEKIYTQEQDFRWGVLAINTNKSIYLPNETAYIQIASLKDDGHTICDANLELKVKSQKSKVETELFTQDGTIKYSGECGPDNVVDVPDYYAYYNVSNVGKYEMKLTNLDNGFEIIDYFEVRDSIEFDVERAGPTRIFPKADYEMKIRIKANRDFQGEIIETVPMTFAITETDGAVQNSIADNYTKTIIWQANLKKGETKELSYYIDFPNTSPYFYLIGPLKIGGWQESREWQIAADALTTVVLNYVQTILTEGTTWTVPLDWNASNSIEVIGGGGAGYSDTAATPVGAGGGGGGAYSKIINLSLVGGNTVYYQVASGGDEGNVNSNDTFFNRTVGSGGDCEADTTSVCAKGGLGATSATGASGGAGASCDGTICISGGAGGTGSTTLDTGGGGGGAGGPGDGETAQVGKLGGIGSTSSTAGSGTGGGGGGNGSAVSADGEAGNTSSGLGGLGGNGNLGSGGGTRGSTSDGGSGTTSGAGGGGGDDGYDGGNGYAGANMRGGVGPGGGGGGSGNTTTAIGMGGDGGLYGAGGGGGRYGGKGAPGVIVITYASNTPTMSSWKVPTNWNNFNNTIEVIGAGGSGCSIAQGNGCAGGGGGAYSKVTNVSLTPGASVAYQIGQGGRKSTIGAGNGQRGSDSFFNRTVGSAGTCEGDTTSVCAKGGEFGNGMGTAGTGGAAASCDGTTCWSGGAGNIGTAADASGGGGGAGGSSQDGRAGGDGSAGNSDGGGGGGGAGDNSGTDSTAGQTGQASTGGNGGAGPGGNGGGTGGATNGPAGTINTGGGGAGGFSAYSGGDGGSGSSTLYGGGGGGGAGDNNATAQNKTYGANGGLFGGGGGGGTANGFGANGVIVVNYTPLEISGVCKQYDQSTNSTEANPIKVAINGTLDANTASCSGGSWTVALAVSPVDIDDVITVWVDNVDDTYEAVAVIKTDGSNNISGVNLYERHLVIGSDDNTIASNSDLSVYDNSVSTDEDIFFDVNGSNRLIGCIVAGCENMELYIGAGDKYAPGSASAAFAEIHDIEIDGTFDMTGTGNYASISGSWWNDATFTPNSSTIFFTASDSTELVSQSTDGTYAFYNVQFGDSATGSWTGHFDLNGNVTALDVNGNLTIDAGTLHVDTKNVTAAGSLSIGTNGAYSTSTGTFTFDGTTAPVNWIDSNSTKSNMGAVTINGTTKHIDLGSSIKATSVTIGADDTLDANGSNTLTLSGSSTPLSNSGTFTCSIGTVAYEGTSATPVAALNGTSHYYNLTVGLSTDTGTFSYTAAGEIEASGSISLIPGSSGVHTFDMSTYNLSVGGAASTGGIAVPAGTVFTQTSGTTKVYSSSGSATVGGAGTTRFYDFQIGNASDGATYTFNLGGDVGASNSFTLAAGTHTLGLSSYEFGIWENWTMGSGASLSAQTGTLNFGDTNSTTLTCSTNCEPYNLTINKTSGTDANDNVTLASNLIVRNTLTITDGQLIQNNDYNVQVEGSTAISIASGVGAEWTNIGTGDLTLGGTFANAGSVSFDTSDGGCTNIDDAILIRSTATGTSRAWSGGGTFNMRNLNVRDQSASGITITVYDGTDAGNTPNWVFAFCGTATPGGGPSPARIKGGTRINGGTRIK